MAKQPTDAENLINAIGALGEMAHTMYTGMIEAGASPQEAVAGMQGFIAAFWHDTMEAARRKQREEAEE